MFSQLTRYPPSRREKGCQITFTHPKFLEPKAFSESDLGDIKVANISCQPGQALLATAAHSNQEGITLRAPQDSADATPGERKRATAAGNPKSSGTKSVLFFT